MQSYSEWLNNKMYEGHVRRLTQIKEKQTKKSKTSKNFRIKSEPAKNYTQKQQKSFLPLPLVSKPQRLLLSEVVKGKSINLRQKQALLQNYLLSKRILQTHSVFNTKQLKKEYNFHKKVSQNMNRNFQNNRKAFSQLRKKKFSQLKRLKQQNYIGVGKISFAIKINQIMLIKRRLQENSISRFNLIYKPQRLKSYAIRSLSYTDLVQKMFYFKATKGQSLKMKGLKFEIEQMRGNQIHKMAEFRLKLQIPQNQINKSQQMDQSIVQKSIQKKKQEFNPEQKNTTIIQTNPSQSLYSFQQKYNDLVKHQKAAKQIEHRRNHSFEFEKTIQKLFHPVSKSLIGTIELNIWNKFV